MELPPRARRILADATVVAAHNGTTSACAENTGAGILQGYAEGNYLRVRGEYLKHQSDTWLRIGTTSACAENTLNELGLL